MWGLLEWWHDAGAPLAFPLETAPLEMRRECPEFFPDQAANGSLMLSYEAETGLLWMWAGPSCFLSRGDKYVGNFLSCSKGVKELLKVPELRCD